MGDRIIGVQFGIASPEEILRRSVVEVTTDNTNRAGQPVAGGVFDPRFGVIENGKVCPTCKETNAMCPGHFGHITLARPVYLYQFIDQIQKILQIVCLNCSNPYLPQEELTKLYAKYKGTELTSAVREKTVSFKTKNCVCIHCGTPAVKKIEKLEGKPASLQAIMCDAESEPIPLQVEIVLRTLERMSDAHIEAVGYDPKFSRPAWMVCTVLAVPPLTVRPSVIMDDNQRMEDDLTHKIIDIVRNNQRLREKIDKGESADIINKYTELLQFDVATYVDNDIKGMPPAAQRSGRPLRTLKARLGAKTGRVRGNLMGKRVDFSARSVITPDPNIALDELGVPQEIAMNLTKPEKVTPYNRDRLMSYIRNGPAKYPGAKSVELKDDKKKYSLKFVKADAIDLKEGDIVHRHLIDDDKVLFNRQPSLHKASMECHRVVVLPYSTFRLNVSATRPYNADFDGDEMNMHVPQSIVAETELQYLATVLRQIISPRTNSPIIQIFQDTMTGSFRISQPDVVIPEHIAMNMLARMQRPLSSYKRKNTSVSGREVISTAFPLMDITNSVKIRNGELVSGVLDKSAFGGGSGSIIQTLYNDMGPKRTGQFINDIQAIVTKYNTFTGFSVGASDLIPDPTTTETIQTKLEQTRNDIRDIISSIHAGSFLNNSGRPDGDELENQITNKTKELFNFLSESVTKSLPKTNRVVQMVDSGAKGSGLNITQMMGLLGQQLVAGKRIQYSLQDRTLPHFAKFDYGIESRGFVENSFINGIRPAECFFHAMGGREGLIDTAVKTSDSGYIQRKLVKSMEDVNVAYDGTVRNVNGAIIQFAYGGDGIDTTAVEKQPCDLGIMSMEQVYSEFALSKADLDGIADGEPDDLIEEILKDRDTLVHKVFQYVKQSSVFAPVNLVRLIAKYKNKYATKTDLTPQYVISALTKLMADPVMKHNKLFHILLRFHLAPKKSIVSLRLTKDMFDELLRDIKYRYMKALVQPGEMVGTLAAQSIGEPTTQLTLNTFHSAGTVKANATAGVPRLEEILSATRNPKNPSNVVYLDASIAGSQDATISKMKEVQQTTIRDITKSVRIYYDPNPLSSNSIVQEDRAILESYEKFSITQNSCVSPWILRLELDPMEMASRNVMDMTLIQAKIENNKVLRVFECIHSDTNTPDKMVMRLVFQPDTVKNALAIRFIEDKLLDTVLTGVDGIGRAYVREIKNEVLYDDKTGTYSSEKQYVLDIDGTNLLDLALISKTDPYRSLSTDIHEILDVFGIEAVRIALYRELMEVFTSEYINYHHLITLIDTMTYPGFIVSVNRAGMNKNENGVLAKSSFEQTSKILFDAAISADFDPMRGVSANIMFGQKPPCGTGFVDILIDETKLPEGDEEVFDTDIVSANEHVERENEKDAAEGECRMEDILMEW